MVPMHVGLFFDRLFVPLRLTSKSLEPCPLKSYSVSTLKNTKRPQWSKKKEPS
jgi:hypothetical protein